MGPSSPGLRSRPQVERLWRPPAVLRGRPPALGARRSSYPSVPSLLSPSLGSRWLPGLRDPDRWSLCASPAPTPPGLPALRLAHVCGPRWEAPVQPSASRHHRPHITGQKPEGHPAFPLCAQLQVSVPPADPTRHRLRGPPVLLPAISWGAAW